MDPQLPEQSPKYVALACPPPATSVSLPLAARSTSGALLESHQENPNWKAMLGFTGTRHFFRGSKK